MGEGRAAGWRRKGDGHLWNICWRPRGAEGSRVPGWGQVWPDSDTDPTQGPSPSRSNPGIPDQPLPLGMAGQKEEEGQLHTYEPWEAGDAGYRSQKVAPPCLASRSWSMRASNLKPGTSVLSRLPGLLEGLPGLKTRTVLCLPRLSLTSPKLGPCLHPRTRGLPETSDCVSAIRQVVFQKLGPRFLPLLRAQTVLSPPPSPPQCLVQSQPQCRLGA